METRDGRSLLEALKLSQSDSNGSKPRPPESQHGILAHLGCLLYLPTWTDSPGRVLSVQLCFLLNREVVGSRGSSSQSSTSAGRIGSCFVQLPWCSPSPSPGQPQLVVPSPFIGGPPGSPELAIVERPAGKGQGVDATGGASGTVKSRYGGSTFG